MLSLRTLAEHIDAEIIGEDVNSVIVRRVMDIRESEPGDVTLLTNSRYEKYLDDCEAAAVIVAPHKTYGARGPIKLVVQRPTEAMAAAIELLTPPMEHHSFRGRANNSSKSGMKVSEFADIRDGATVEIGARVGDWTVVYPGCYIASSARIGRNCVLHPNVVVRDGVTVGDGVTLHSGVVLGSEGFGFTRGSDGIVSTPQVGKVIIGDDVSVGANSTIDRATVGSTVIGDGAKIDNLVHIAHNVKIDKNAILCGQVGIAGSTEIGEGALILGQAGVAGHLNVGRGSLIGAQAGVSKSVPDGVFVSGYPARPHGELHKMLAAGPASVKKLKKLEKLIESGEHVK